MKQDKSFKSVCDAEVDHQSKRKGRKRNVRKRKTNPSKLPESSHSEIPLLNLAGKAVESGKDFAGKAVESGKDFAGKAVESGKDFAGKAVESGKELAGKAVELSGKAVELSGRKAVELSGRAVELSGKAVELSGKAVESVEDFVGEVWEKSWRLCTFHELPEWLRDNDFLHTMHRPQLPSFRQCLKSIFKIHSETGNIWTHLLGCVVFMGIAIHFLWKPTLDISGVIMMSLDEQLVFLIFFACAVLCLGFSTAFHTLSCHSKCVEGCCVRLDYCGIAVMITGSFVPWLYYGFYCDSRPKMVYTAATVTLGAACIIVSMWEKFSQSRFRPFRAGVFLTFGLSGFFPVIHYLVKEGWIKGMVEAQLQWLFLMAFLYVLGALLYAFRIPERYFPGKCDVIFQSHQIFHVLVVSAAFVHYHGISKMAMYRMNLGSCPADQIDL